MTTPVLMNFSTVLPAKMYAKSTLHAEFAHLIGPLNGNHVERAVLDHFLQVLVVISEANRLDLACLAGLLNGAAHADRRRLVGAEDADEVRIGGPNVGRFVVRGPWPSSALG